MYKTILVGFDDSDFSKAALIEASNWIKRHGGKLILVHTVFFDTEEFGIAPEQLDKRLRIGEKVCVQTKEMLTSEFGIEVESLLCEGEPPEVIVEIAREKKADLIMLGTYGRRGFKRLLMGSVTSQVVVNAPVDVLVVKKPCTECTGEYKSILVPFDGSPSAQKALERACHLSKIDNAEINILYVIPRYEEMVEFFKSSSIKKSLFQEAQKIIDTAKEIASKLGVSAKDEIQEGNAAEKIVESSRKLKHGLIVMGSYGYTGVNKAIIGSTAERVITNAACPILVVR
ncbi:MAG: universal stress protein [Thermodesulfovibrionia bacterium]|nr:universal stress protein [Thermodesulfovibrionia bacterium]